MAPLQYPAPQPRKKIELELLPGGQSAVRATQPQSSFGQLRGILKGKTNGARLSIEEIDQAIAEAGLASPGLAPSPSGRGLG